MKPFTLEWVDKAEEDWEIAQLAHESPKSRAYNAICFHAQQCAEKYLKRALLHNSRPCHKRPCHKRPCRERHGYWARTPKTHRFAGLKQFYPQFHSQCRSQCREAVLLGVFAD